MNRIFKLSSDVIAKLKAGEVIENPAHIVKELLENALDAGASFVKLEVLNGGKDLIRITDNGTGIHKDDLEYVFDAHTTSKIRHLDEIEYNGTLGFRGEALFALSAVAKVQLMTRTAEDENTYEINPEHLEVQTSQTLSEKGTRIIVTELFANQPVRLKFLKSYAKEWESIFQVLIAYALRFPALSLEAWHNNQKALSLKSHRHMKERFASIYPGSSDLYDWFEFDEKGLKVRGGLRKARFCQNRPKPSILFVNKRWVHNKELLNLIRYAYEKFFRQKEKPDGVLCFEVPASWIDVNAHPRKSEIRFKDFEQIREYFERGFQNWFLEAQKRAPISEPIRTLAHSKGYSHVGNTEKGHFLSTDVPFRQKNTYRPSVSTPWETGCAISSPSAVPIQMNTSENIAVSTSPLPLSLVKVSTTPLLNLPSWRFIGQFHDCYLLFEHESDLWVIDQHALHERLIFEKILKDYQDKGLPSQLLLSSFQMELEPLYVTKLDMHKPILQKLGFQFNWVAPYLVWTGIPYIFEKLHKDQIIEIFRNWLHEARDNWNVEDMIEYFFYEWIAQQACHRALRKGDSLMGKQALELLKQAQESRFWAHCPHGRPVLKRLTLHEVEMWFHR